MNRYIIPVVVEAATLDQAEQVVSERIHHDEDYGFKYTIDVATPAERAALSEACWYKADDLEYRLDQGVDYSSEDEPEVKAEIKRLERLNKEMI